MCCVWLFWNAIWLVWIRRTRMIYRPDCDNRNYCCQIIGQVAAFYYGDARSGRQRRNQRLPLELLRCHTARFDYRRPVIQPIQLGTVRSHNLPLCPWFIINLIGYYLFLSRWHFLKRIRHRKNSLSANNGLACNSHPELVGRFPLVFLVQIFIRKIGLV